MVLVDRRHPGPIRNDGFVHAPEPTVLEHAQAAVARIATGDPQAARAVLGQRHDQPVYEAIARGEAREPPVLEPRQPAVPSSNPDGVRAILEDGVYGAVDESLRARVRGHVLLAHSLKAVVIRAQPEIAIRIFV
jgi:hypothetical protein